MENNLGIRHLALKVKNFNQCFVFYTEILGMSIDWKPDDNNVYLTNGSDNLALHYDSNVSCNSDDSRLDHFGIFVKNKDDIVAAKDENSLGEMDTEEIYLKEC